MMQKPIPLILCALLALPLSVLAAEKASPLLGQPAPMLSGIGTSGHLINLQQMRREVAFIKDAQGQLVKLPNGRLKTEVTDYVIVLNFFATYCKPCVREIPTFNRIATAYPGQPVRFVYVNVDAEKSPEEVKAFAKTNGIAVEMMFPSLSYVVKTYRVESLPRIIVVDRGGKISTVITGFQDDLSAQLDGIIKPLLPKD